MTFEFLLRICKQTRAYWGALLDQSCACLEEGVGRKSYRERIKYNSEGEYEAPLYKRSKPLINSGSTRMWKKNLTSSIRSEIDFSKSSIREPSSSIRPIIASLMVWKRVCICCSKLWTWFLRADCCLLRVVYYVTVILGSSYAHVLWVYAMGLTYKFRQIFGTIVSFVGLVLYWSCRYDLRATGFGVRNMQRWSEQKWNEEMIINIPPCWCLAIRKRKWPGFMTSNKARSRA